MTLPHLIGARALERHPDSPAMEVHGLEVEVSTADGRLELRYRLRAEMAALAIPEAGPPARADGLWRHTCFEAFVAPAASSRYFEYNFSPSRAWAAYGFESYRAGMTPLATSAPAIDCHLDGQHLALRVSVELAGSARPGPLRLGVAAVIEDRQGRLSYWALAHAPGKADFHRAESFVVEVP